jgi:hypothetical protein
VWFFWINFLFIQHIYHQKYSWIRFTDALQNTCFISENILCDFFELIFYIYNTYTTKNIAARTMLLWRMNYTSKIYFRVAYNKQLRDSFKYAI